MHHPPNASRGIERTIPWLTGYGRLHHRYERPRTHLAVTLCHDVRRLLQLSAQGTGWGEEGASEIRK
ncbi:hypothetical protein [Streptomyces sp. NPDC001880]